MVNDTNATNRLYQTASPAAVVAAADAEESMALGLGFVDASSSSSSSAASQQLVQDLMKQCLAYHQDQLVSQLPVVSQPSYHDESQQPQQHHEERQHETALPFVKPVQQDLVMNDDQEGMIPSTTTITTTTETIPEFSTTTTSTTAAQTQAAQEAVARARAIIQSFQQRSTSATRIPNVDGAWISSSSHTDMTYSTIYDDTYNNNNSLWKSRRDAQLQVERQRLDQALFKNFTYLEQREQQRLQQQLQHIDQVQQQLEQRQKQHQIQLQKQQQQQQQQQQNRRRHIPIAGIGIETSQRSHKRNKVNNSHATSTGNPNQRRNMSTTMALYISNLLPTTSEEVIRQLFSSYGTIQKIHFYYHKQTGAFKGDGLVIYERDSQSMENITDVLQSICQQLNGCELPCGSILHIEPAKLSSSSQPSPPPPIETKTDEVPKVPLESTTPSLNSTTEVPEEPLEDDLDDFFASLT